jgi:voltage-gated potassium channel
VKDIGVATPALRPRDLLILGLSVYVLLALLIEGLLPVSNDIHAILEAGDTIACFVFIGDFFYRFWKAPAKTQFLKWGWIDLVASIPSVDALRWGRMIRLIRLIRVFRAARGAVSIVSVYRHHRTEAVAATMFIMFLFTLLLSSIAILTVETSPGSNIHTGGDALWWSISTISTVGYGDKFPVTTEGKVIAAMLMVFGIGLMGALTGLIASSFVRSPSSLNQNSLTRIEADLRILRADVGSLLTVQASQNQLLNTEHQEFSAEPEQD